MKKTEITKKNIIDATIKILRQNGNVTVKEIAAEAHVNIAAINYHFNDKESLIVLVVNQLIGSFKSTIDSFLNSKADTKGEIQQTIRAFLDTFYNFVFENIGIIKYILIPNNKDILNDCSQLFMSQFSMNSETTAKIVEKLALNNPTYSADELKVKYVLLFSAFAFPLIFQLNLQNIDNNALFQIDNGTSREIYIDQLTKVILS